MQSRRYPADDKSLQPIGSQLSLTRHFRGCARQASEQVERFGATESLVVHSNLLRGLVGAWGFEPQTPTVSR